MSPFLRELLEEHLSLGPQEVTVILDPSLAVSSLTLLMEYLYTGQCGLASRQQAAGVLELARLLQLDSSLQLLGREQEALPQIPRDLQESFLQRPREDDKFTLQQPNKGSISTVSEDHKFSLQLPTRPTPPQLPSEVPESFLHFSWEDKAIIPYLPREDRNTTKQFELHMTELLEDPPNMPTNLKLESFEQEPQRLRGLTNFRWQQLEDRRRLEREDHEDADQLQMKEQKYSLLPTKDQHKLLQMTSEDPEFPFQLPGKDQRDTSLQLPEKCPDIFLQLPGKRIKLSDLQAWPLPLPQELQPSGSDTARTTSCWGSRR